MDLRKIFHRTVSPDPENNKIDNFGDQNEYHEISDQTGSTDSHHQNTVYHLSGCHCFRPPGGRCGEDHCGKVCCEEHHIFCGGKTDPQPEGCRKPLCQEHVYYHTFDDGRKVPLCRRCYQQARRTSRWTSLGKFLFNPFIDFGGPDAGK
jgi:hypothetical protein